MRNWACSFVLFLLFQPLQPLSAIDKTPTGFYYPTGTKKLGDLPGFLSTPPVYFKGLYHLGKDIKAEVKMPVYAISNGTIVRISMDERGWGKRNVALIIQHKLENGKSFYAVYGHIRTVLKQGMQVEGGQVIGTIGPYPFTSHLHFGIYPGLKPPSRPLGLWYLPKNWKKGSPLDPKGFVDPISFIETQRPFGIKNVAQPGWKAISACHEVFSSKGLNSVEFFNNQDIEAYKRTRDKYLGLLMQGKADIFVRAGCSGPIDNESNKTWVYCDAPDKASLLAAIRKGQTIATREIVSIKPIPRCGTHYNSETEYGFYLPGFQVQDVDIVDIVEFIFKIEFEKKTRFNKIEVYQDGKVAYSESLEEYWQENPNSKGFEDYACWAPIQASPGEHWYVIEVENFLITSPIRLRVK